MQALWLALFSITAGFTASGIVANLYRLSGASPDTNRGRTLRLIVMSVAGPTVIFETAVKGLKAKEWTALGFWMVIGVIGYWSLAIGLFIIDIAMHV